MRYFYTFSAYSITALFIAATAVTLTASAADTTQPTSSTGILGLSETASVYRTLPLITRWLPSHLEDNLKVLEPKAISLCLQKFDEKVRKSYTPPMMGFQITSTVDTGTIECGRYISQSAPKPLGTGENSYPGCWVTYTPKQYGRETSLHFRYDVSLGFPYMLITFDHGTEGHFLHTDSGVSVEKPQDSVFVDSDGAKDTYLWFLSPFRVLNHGVGVEKPNANTLKQLGQRAMQLGEICGPSF